jgi:hypothetical protein
MNHTHPYTNFQIQIKTQKAKMVDNHVVMWILDPYTILKVQIRTQKPRMCDNHVAKWVVDLIQFWKFK